MTAEEIAEKFIKQYVCKYESAAEVIELSSLGNEQVQNLANIIRKSEEEAEKRGAEREREECAKLCGSRKCYGDIDPEGQLYYCGPELAEAIRKRGEG